MDFQKLCAFYENEGSEELRLQENSPHYLEYLTATTYLQRYLQPNSKILDNCAGSGAYAFHLAGQGHSVTAGDIVPYNVNLIREKQQKNHLLAEIYEGDATDLSQFETASFDAVLCMGALYHLHDASSRKRALDEGARLLRSGGLFFCTYMNRYAVILNNCSGSLDNLDEIMLFAKEGKEGVFYAATPSETESLARSSGLEIIRHIALDGVANFMRQTAKLINDEGFKRWRSYHFAVCEETSLLGYSYHNMLICRSLEATDTPVNECSSL